MNPERVVVEPERGAIDAKRGMNGHNYIETLLRGLLLTLLVACCARAEGAVSREDQLKAAYLFNFLKFVEWPATVQGDAITICFVGADGLYDALRPGIENRRAASRKLALRRLAPSEEPRDCQVLYVAASASGNGAVKVASGQPMLTVSDAADFGANGGMIELFTVDDRLRFNVDVSHVQQAGLHISADLLQLAAKVRRSGS